MVVFLWWCFCGGEVMFLWCRTFKIVVKCKLLMSPSDPFVTSCGLGAQNCSKIQYFVVRSSTVGIVIKHRPKFY